VLLLAAGVSLLAPAMVHWARASSIAATADAKIVHYGTLAVGHRTA
jgi:hypothetical protein